ncbi:MAG TPA: hypothetical protein VLE47_00195 [Candidatus Saccharimonadales bacterium]|nr:hypothetical protein [Candidatus Saccharimonadales bacterium]
MGKIIDDPNSSRWVTLAEIAPKDIRIEVRRSKVKRKRHARAQIAKLDKAWEIVSENVRIWRESNESVKIKERFKKAKLSFIDSSNILVEFYFTGPPRLLRYGVDDLLVQLTEGTYVSFQRNIGKDLYHITISATYTKEIVRT